ncbi:MAG TPA: SDR family oxidoreductase [Kofleriaceae bacterium]|nr:SDR family oxidoreductase [Kofleriaceae bacterium]
MSTIAITGANRGIGLELTRQCEERGDQVIAICRNRSAELDALGVQVVSGIDVTSDDDVARLARELADLRLDVLINDAGVLVRNSLDRLDVAGIRRQFEVNSLGPLRVTTALMPLLARGSKVAIVTSRMGSIADNTSGGSYGYRMSKAAVNAAGKSLAHDLAPRGIAVVLLHPGYVRTDMTGHSGNVDPADAARDLLARIDELEMSSTGTFRHANGEELPW